MPTVSPTVRTSFEREVLLRKWLTLAHVIAVVLMGVSVLYANPPPWHPFLLRGSRGSLNPLLLVLTTVWPLLVSWRISRNSVPVDVRKFIAYVLAIAIGAVASILWLQARGTEERIFVSDAITASGLCGLALLLGGSVVALIARGR